MTSPAAIAANRRNARASTGPKTAAGKARASRNAARHGLNALTLDRAALAELGALARRIAGDWARNEMALCHALRIAVAQRAIQRIRVLKARRMGIVAQHCAERRPFLETAQSVREVAALDRYERRAFSQRRTAIRAFYRALAGQRALAAAPPLALRPLLIGIPPRRSTVDNLRAAILAKRTRLRQRPKLRRPNVRRVVKVRRRRRLCYMSCGKTPEERLREREPLDSRSDRGQWWGDLTKGQRKAAEHAIATFFEPSADESEAGSRVRSWARSRAKSREPVYPWAALRGLRGAERREIEEAAARRWVAWFRSL